MSHQSRLARRFGFVVVTELLFVAATRVVLHYYPWSSPEAESIRTLLRIVTVFIYWWLLKPVIFSRTPNLSALRHPPLVIGILLLLLVPILITHSVLPSNIAILFAFASIPVAVKEEFLFRGIVQNLLSEKIGALKAVLLTSTLFMVWHIGVWDTNLWTFTQIFLASAVLGLIYVRSGSIVAVIVLHAAYDALFSAPQFVVFPEYWGFLLLLGSATFILWKTKREEQIYSSQHI